MNQLAMHSAFADVENFKVSDRGNDPLTGAIHYLRISLSFWDKKFLDDYTEARWDSLNEAFDCDKMGKRELEAKMIEFEKWERGHSMRNKLSLQEKEKI